MIMINISKLYWADFPRAVDFHITNIICSFLALNLGSFLISLHYTYVNSFQINIYENYFQVQK